MTTTFISIISLLAGFGFFGAIWAIIKSTTRQINAIEANTTAVSELKGEMTKLKNGFARLNGDVQYLKGRIK